MTIAKAFSERSSLVIFDFIHFITGVHVTIILMVEIKIFKDNAFRSANKREQAFFKNDDSQPIDFYHYYFARVLCLLLSIVLSAM